jgi:hypothetical protein
MKIPVLISAITVFSILSLSGQNATGTLKVFSEEPVIVFVDGTHCPEYGAVSLVPGTHYVKALNKDEVKVYSEIVSIKAGQVTSILIETPAVQQQPVRPGLVYGQTVPEADSQPPAAGAGETPESHPAPTQSIDIGQEAGVLPGDMSGAFGLRFGMDIRDVDKMMTARSAKTQRNADYYVYAITYGSSVYVVECRFIDHKLFQIIVGYPNLVTDNAKLKLNKEEIPYAEFNRMCSDVTSCYGAPAKTEKIFKGGYAENDGRLIEALRRNKALIYYTWTDPKNGNYIYVVMGYTNAPLAATVYTSGELGAEAERRRLRIHAYDYNKSFAENYFSN